jgi:hypothetical protein
LWQWCSHYFQHSLIDAKISSVEAARLFISRWQLLCSGGIILWVHFTSFARVLTCCALSCVSFLILQISLLAIPRRTCRISLKALAMVPYFIFTRRYFSMRFDILNLTWMFYNNLGYFF